MVDTRGCMKTRLFLSVLNVLILLNPNTNGFPVNLTFVKNAVARGAVCLDGSPSAYHFSPGFGSGVNNWLVHMEGGGWCRSPEECLSRIDSTRGSSKKMKQMSFSGILSNQKKYNPDFFNWNKVKVRYCDGSSFTGDVKSINPETNLHFRGATVWLAVIDDLLAKGMSNAENALLSGCSAGGLASILHCDRFGDLLPASATVKCLSDAGYFINVKDISGTEHIKAFFDEVVSTHGSVKNLPPSCTSKSTPKMCFFPQYVLKWMRTPVFILNAAYDSWQIKNILAPSSADVDGSWHDCKLDLATCSLNQLAILQGYRMEFLHALPRFSPAGMFINSCYAHCQSGTQATWLSSGSPMINGVTIAKAVGSWFYNRGAMQYIDHCPYPCKLSCLNGTNELEMTLEQGSNQSLKKLKPSFEY